MNGFRFHFYASERDEPPRIHESRGEGFAKIGWTARVLNHQMENKSFEKYLLYQTNFNNELPDQYQNQAILVLLFFIFQHNKR